jgi:hypothetical protein
VTEVAATIAVERRPPLRGITLLLPVWGHRHLALFLDAALPSLLWPGNLPALSGALPCEFVVMTGSDEVETLVAHPNWHRLERLCPVRIVTIDDLISDASYAVTMTLAYAQAIRAVGPALLDTGFLFLAADFLFADGALAAVLARLQAGASGVLAGNFQIEAAVGGTWPGGPVAADAPMAPRPLLRWSLDHLHAATRRAVVNADYRHDDSANRLFWRIDDTALLGRFYLLHMIGIRPEVSDFTIGAASDYSFIPELCPSGRVVVLTDSDEYFVTEMQGDVGDGEDKTGPELFDPRAVAAGLSRWTTVGHREHAQHTLLFHAADLPLALTERRAEADAAIAAIAEHLSPVPQPHRDHPYWIGGMALRRATTGRGGPPLGPGLRGAATRLWWRFRLAGFGRPPDLRPWHPRWPDFVAAGHWLGRGGAVLILSDEPHSFAAWAARFAAEAISLPRERLDSSAGRRHIVAAGPFDRCLVVLPDGGADIADSIGLLGSVLKPGGEIIVLAIKDLRDDPAVLDPANLTALECGLRATGWAMQSSRLAAGPVRRAVQQALVDVARATRRAAKPAAALAFFACGFLAFLSFACNQIAVRTAARRNVGRCSSAIFVLRRPAGPPCSP